MKLRIVKSILQVAKNGYSCPMLTLEDLSIALESSQVKYTYEEAILSQQVDKLSAMISSRIIGPFWTI